MKRLGLFLAACFTICMAIRKRNVCDKQCIDSPHDAHRERYNKQPNIVYVMADDMGWNDVGFHNSKVKTPNIDSLRSNGITLTQLYMQPVCSASRSALVTGKYPSNNGIQLQVVSRESQTCLPLEHKTIFQHMKEEGYATKYIGKWHLGYCDTSCMPMSRGVDEFRGIYAGSADYFNWTEYTVVQRRVNDEPSIEHIGTHLTLLETQDLREMILDHKDKPEPLFMWISPTAPHDPLQPTKEMFDVHDFLDAENTETNKRRRYLGLVSAFDDLLGETIKVLREAELDQNTVIIFSSDNGGASQSTESSFYDYYANNYPLRNGKFTFMEGGVRVPAVYYDPRLHSRTRGTERDFLMHATDWFPTFIQMAKPGRKTSNFEIPGIDGVSQLANLGSTYNCAPERKYNKREEMLVALTDATNRFMNPPNCTTEDAAYRWRDYKLVYGNQYYLVDPSGLDSEWPKPEESPELPNITGDDCHRIENGSRVVRCLFNVIDDPNETKNIYDDEPGIVSMLLERIEAARRVSVKAVYHPPLGPTNFTTQHLGPYLIPRHDYCTPSVHFPLEPADPACYE